MDYTPSQNLKQVIAHLSELDSDRLDRIIEWNLARMESNRKGLLRVDQSYTQRLRFLHSLLDCEALDRAITREVEYRDYTPCPTCSDEGHVEDIDSPHDTIRECPTCK
jgi:hypothetical protein